MQAPVFSIITVIFNGKKLLEGTMHSVLCQKALENVEYIVIDGGSTDGTVELIAEYASKFQHFKWISEKDKGLYDAMNKGLQMASGEFVWFLNAGDHLHDPETVLKMLSLVQPEVGIIYGETLLVNEQRKPAGTMSELSTRKCPDRLTYHSFLGGMLVVHQSFVPRRQLAGAYMEGNLCADYDWCIRILKKSKLNMRAPFILTDYLMGGMSKQRHKQSLKDRFSVMRAHYGLILALLSHAWILIRAALHRLIRRGKDSY